MALTYRPQHIIDGVYAQASIDYHPPARQKRSSPNWDYQERTLNVYFENNPSDSMAENGLLDEIHAIGRYCD